MPASLARRLAIADQQFGGGAPVTWHVGLSLVLPNADGSGFVEPPSSGVAYGRVAVTNNLTNWPAASIIEGLPRKRNGTKITFANPTGPWGKLLYWILLLTSTGGSTAEYWGKIAEIAPKAGNTPVEFDVNQLVLPF